MKNLIMCLICGELLMVAVAVIQQEVPSVKSLPPSVIRTVPECGDMNVDTNTTTRITVTFSKEMKDNSWSWCQISDDTFPKILGEPRYLDDKKTCVADVNLEPNKTYVVRFNDYTDKFGNFKDTGDRSALPYQLVFETK